MVVARDTLVSRLLQISNPTLSDMNTLECNMKWTSNCKKMQSKHMAQLVAGNGFKKKTLRILNKL